MDAWGGGRGYALEPSQYFLNTSTKPVGGGVRCGGVVGWGGVGWGWGGGGVGVGGWGGVRWGGGGVGVGGWGGVRWGGVVGRGGVKGFRG